MAFKSEIKLSPKINIDDVPYVFPLQTDETSFQCRKIDLKNLEKGIKIDEGNFGVVYKARLTIQKEPIINKINVAIKEIKAHSNESQMEMKNEAELMQRLNHPFVIKFIGICDEDVSHLKIILEYAELGSLNKYLKTLKKQLRTDKLVNFCYQIALAMEYLSSQGVVHRDLAARNVLLFNEELCKVTDFGLSRYVDDSKYYTQSRETRLPIRWYPLDLIKSDAKKFDEKSDVWSFGVTCWETMSFGAIPYENVINLLSFLEKGDRLGNAIKSSFRLD